MLWHLHSPEGELRRSRLGVDPTAEGNPSILDRWLALLRDGELDPGLVGKTGSSNH
jgi:hypothetical protein